MEESPSSQESDPRVRYFGEWLRSELTRLNHPAWFISSTLGKEADWVSRIEAGEVRPTREEVEQIARATGIFVTDALVVAGYLESVLPDPDIARYITDCLNQLSTEQQAQLRLLMKGEARRITEGFLAGRDPRESS